MHHTDQWGLLADALWQRCEMFAARRLKNHQPGAIMGH
jgi:hypothetical protein